VNDLCFPLAPPYLRLKLARKLFDKAPDQLDAAQALRVEQVAVRQLDIERRILATREAAQVVLPASSLERAVAEVRRRYASEDEFIADLDKIGLDPAGLAAAIEGDLRVEGVLEQVASRVAEASATDAEIFYLLHRARFRRPETRRLRHILITINASLPGNERPLARKKSEEIRARLRAAPERFAEQALKHSECPTALNGGDLGVVQRGQLFAELEPGAFALAAGELSEVLESPLGFHLIECTAATAEGELALEEVQGDIRARLTESRRSAAQKEWIAALPATGD